MRRQALFFYKIGGIVVGSMQRAKIFLLKIFLCNFNVLCEKCMFVQSMTLHCFWLFPSCANHMVLRKVITVCAVHDKWTVRARRLPSCGQVDVK